MPNAALDLYGILEVEHNASKDEIRKAYHKLALAHHPDKVAEADRAQADIKFKSISQAYEILYDDEQRKIFDEHGMTGFDSGSGMGGTSFEDLFNMFGNSTYGVGGGLPGMGSRVSRKGQDVEQRYEVTLEDVYRGRTIRFASTKNVICNHCKGKGGKKNAKARHCSLCDGKGVKLVIRQQDGFLSQQMAPCSSCQGTGFVFNDQDKCKKCKGNRTVAEKKMLELYIPPGASDGERIAFQGEADQIPDQEPGDIIFILQQKLHDVFERRRSDLIAHLKLTLAEALCGFSRVVIKSLDGRGLSVSHQKPTHGVLKPGQIIKIIGEGMPVKKANSKGDLYLIVDVAFPEDDWLQNEALTSTLQEILPKPNPLIQTEIVDEVEHEADSVTINASGDSQDSEWDDQDEYSQARVQCPQQ